MVAKPAAPNQLEQLNHALSVAADRVAQSTHRLRSTADALFGEEKSNDVGRPSEARPGAIGELLVRADQLHQRAEELERQIERFNAL